MPALIERGLLPEHVVVDFGCGSLRLGIHLMEYLHYGHYWGLDVTRTFIDIGMDLIGADRIAERAPHLYSIDAGSLAAAAAATPDFIIASSVLPHVPESEVESFLDRVVSMMTAEARALVQFWAGEAMVRHLRHTWLYPKSFIGDLARDRQARAEFETTATGIDGLTGHVVEEVWMTVTLA